MAEERLLLSISHLDAAGMRILHRHQLVSMFPCTLDYFLIFCSTGCSCCFEIVGEVFYGVGGALLEDIL